jgi:hypothetical protein
MTGKQVLNVLTHVWTILADTGVPAAVMGGVAVAAWRRIRATHDVDLLIDLDNSRFAEVFRALDKGGVHRKHMAPFIAVGDTRFIQFLYDLPDLEAEVRVDLLLADSPFQRQALARAVEPKSSLGRGIRVLSCEDLILFKLLAGRIIDRADAAYLLRVNRDELDLAHLNKWAQSLAIEATLKEIWREAFPDEASSSTDEPGT